MSKRKLVAIENWDEPKYGISYIIKDSWWVVNENDEPLFCNPAPKKFIPQCNMVKAIAETIAGGRPIKYFNIVYTLMLN